ncbi:MAG: DUF2207 domain-containing protein [Sulfurovum sp.]|nr:DUF2207 domain-containing protein [Sulfurovum sp.]
MQKVLLSLFLFCLSTLFIYAEKIASYDINVSVKQSGELFIFETIQYDFEGETKHGIYRDIPFTIKINNRIKDIGLSDFDVKINNRYVPWTKSTMKSAHAGKIVRLKIGDASTYVTGKKIYNITYRVKMGVFPSSNNEKNDAIRWNIIGTGWDVPIENIKANFFLPTTLTQNIVSVSSYTGAYGEKDSTANIKWVNPQHIFATVEQLNPHEGATVELSFPTGILDQSGVENLEPSTMDWFLENWFWGVLAGFLLYFSTMYKRYIGFEDKRSIAVQYEAPKGLSVLQSGLILDKFADNEDFSAAILELGYLGYLTIEQKDKRYNPVLKRTDKNADTLTMDQQYLLDHILFKASSTFIMSEKSEDKAQTLLSGFSYINDNLYDWSVSDGYMTDNPKRIRKNFLWKSILFLSPVFALMIYTYVGPGELMGLIFSIIFGTIGFRTLMNEKSWISRFVGFIFLNFGLASLYALFDSGIDILSLLLGPLGVFMVLIGLLYFLYKKIGPFTKKGAYTSSHLLGLKTYISRVKEDEIKRRLEEDSLYLEKLLPYAVLFKESKHWLSFYDLLKVETPHWYMGSVHNIESFSSSVDNTATPPSTSASSGGGFSGGGSFSGGGGGGGGGGSW